MPKVDTVYARVMGDATEAVPLLSEWLPNTVFSPLVVPTQRGWTSFNPSLVVRRDGRVQATVRSSNYRIDATGRYEIDDPQKIVRSMTRIVDLDEQLRPGAASSIRELADATVYESTIRGYEDVRLFESDHGLGALAVVRDRDSSPTCRIVLLELDDSAQVTRELLIAGPDSDRHEKNWIPIRADRDTLHLIYAWDPLHAGELNLSTGALRLAPPAESAWHGARGGGGGASIDGRADGDRLFVVHEPVTMPDWSRRYVHKFVTVSADGAPRRSSPYFVFLGHGIEFAAGLVIVDGRVLVSFGREDAEAWIASFPASELRARMEAA